MSTPREFETYRGVVYPNECDINLHMNITQYMARFDTSNWHILAHLGLGPARVRGERITCIALKTSIQYLKEVVAGDLLCNSSAVVWVRNPEIGLQTRMFNACSGEPVALFEEHACCFDLDSRRPVPFPDDVLDAAVRLMGGEEGRAAA